MSPVVKRHKLNAILVWVTVTQYEKLVSVNEDFVDCVLMKSESRDLIIFKHSISVNFGHLVRVMQA